MKKWFFYKCIAHLEHNLLIIQATRWKFWRLSHLERNAKWGFAINAGCEKFSDQIEISFAYIARLMKNDSWGIKGKNNGKDHSLTSLTKSNDT